MERESDVNGESRDFRVDDARAFLNCVRLAAFANPSRKLPFDSTRHLIITLQGSLNFGEASLFEAQCIRSILCRDAKQQLMSSSSTLTMAPVAEEYDPKVWVIHREYDDGDTSLVEAHVSYESALAGMKAMGHIKVDLQELQLKSVIDVDAPKKKSKKRFVLLKVSSARLRRCFEMRTSLKNLFMHRRRESPATDTNEQTALSSCRLTA